ncbi:MAG: hypothetical protein COV67_07190 [Nitrospinae bacterium CG11_big_fil_rev_8_21_14_0_20_56_8]|nr:MAG: hypothetical protein COV67_07190 [Nitrospinae bacterium CG11_big_fil_rev_8_21_14_0_20_56_8]
MKRSDEMTRSILESERGNTVLIFLMILTVMATLALGAIQLVNLEMQSTQAHRKSKTAFYSAEVGLDLAVNEIIEEFEDLSVYTNSGGPVTADNYRGYSVTYEITNPVDKFLYQTVAGNTTIYHYAYTYNVESDSTSLTDKSKEHVQETIRILETPLVQYYVFYGGSGNDADLEVLPGPTMNSWGRIHANGDIYIGSNATFNLRNYDDANNQSPHGITAGGNVYLKRKDDSSTFPSDRVNIKTDNTGTTFSPVETMTGDVTSDNESSEETRFNDYLLVNEQTYSAPAKTQFTRGGFYEQKAGNPERPTVDGIRIIGTGGVGTGQIEIYVSRPAADTDVTALIANGESSAGNAIAGFLTPVQETNNAFQDCRESDRNVDTTDIDLYALGQWYEAYLADLGLSLAGDGILIYASRTGANEADPNTGTDLNGIRLTKIDATSQAQLSDETTLATDNPIYIQGDFNTVDTKGVALIGDAINVLSNAFTGKTCNGALSAASNTTIYAAFFGGNVPTPAGGGTYSGGLENYPRFHESWSGKSCNIRGSFINLWTSSQADGSWVYGSDRYQAPTRNWGWDVRFQDPDFWPPFIPSIFSVERVGYLE